MMTKAELACKLKVVEDRLNKLEIEGCSLGSALAKFHENIYNNALQNLSPSGFTKIVITQWIKGLFISNPNTQVYSNKILLSKITSKDHTNALINPIKEHFKTKAIMYTPDSENEIIPYGFPRRYTPVSILKISLAIFNHFVEIYNIYRKEGLELNRAQLALTLMIQINSFRNWHLMFKENRPVMIIVDFDRDNRNATMLLAANKYNIQTVTLVHGTINPHIGFSPLIADEIWCWGSFQKRQLISLGISEQKIKINGSPIARKLINKVRDKPKKYIKTIGLGLNPMGEKYNFELLSYLFENDYDSRIEWIVKLHPSMIKSKWMFDMEKENVTIYESTFLSTKDFFNAIDLLIVGNSGIGYEAVVNGIPIWVYSPNNEGLFHDKVMILYGNCPDITNMENLVKHFNCLFCDPEYLKLLLENEKSFVLGEFYSCIGIESANNIIKSIQKKMVNVY